MNDKASQAFKDGASFTMDQSFDFFGGVCIALSLFLVAIVIYCLLKGLGDESINIAEMAPILIRSIICVLILGSLIYFQ